MESNNSWSKSARSLKYSPHWGALQDFEMTNAKIFTTQQLSKLWLISKSFAKELVNTKMNNILKFHQNPLTINACHIKIKFKLKLGWGFSQRGMDKSQRWSTAHTAVCGRKALINKCTYNFGQNKSGKSEHFSDTQPCLATCCHLLVFVTHYSISHYNKCIVQWSPLLGFTLNAVLKVPIYEKNG